MCVKNRWHIFVTTLKWGGSFGERLVIPYLSDTFGSLVHHYSDVIISKIASQITSNCLFKSKKTSKLHVTGLCEGNSPVTGEFPAQGQVTWKMFPFADVITYCGVFQSSGKFAHVKVQSCTHHINTSHSGVFFFKHMHLWCQFCEVVHS